VDVDDTYTVDVRDAAAKVTPRTVGFVPVHLYGQAADLPGIQALCEKHGLWLLEDCAQAHGAEWQGKKVGGFGRAGAFSFYPSKNLNVMGDGGLIVTNDDAVAARCRQIRDHGRLNKDVHAEVGFNLRFNDIQPAVAHLKAPDLPVTDRIVRHILTLPISAGHTEDEADEVVAAVREFFRG
jgi:dTDP-4-amino-4,6-dideoxygalactose transaminase